MTEIIEGLGAEYIVTLKLCVIIYSIYKILHLILCATSTSYSLNISVNNPLPNSSVLTIFISRTRNISSKFHWNLKNQIRDIVLKMAYLIVLYVAVIKSRESRGWEFPKKVASIKNRVGSNPKMSRVLKYVSKYCAGFFVFVIKTFLDLPTFFARW